jgi:hypothetical protein
MEGTKEEDWVVILEIIPRRIHYAAPDGNLKDHYVTGCGMHVSVDKRSSYMMYGRYSDEYDDNPDLQWCERCHFKVEDILDGGRMKRIFDELP